jgi:formate dehydrogenase subunit delta
MTIGELEHLIQMSNQIAANFSFHDDAEARIADHITRFWAPSMKKLLSGHIEQGGEGVEEAVRKAMQEISDV